MSIISKEQETHLAIKHANHPSYTQQQSRQGLLSGGQTNLDQHKQNGQTLIPIGLRESNREIDEKNKVVRQSYIKENSCETSEGYNSPKGIVKTEKGTYSNAIPAELDKIKDMEISYPSSAVVQNRPRGLPASNYAGHSGPFTQDQTTMMHRNKIMGKKTIEENKDM